MAVLVVCVFANGAQSWHEKMLAAPSSNNGSVEVGPESMYFFFASKHRGQIPQAVIMEHVLECLEYSMA